ncbi:MAG: hypothetical protein LBN42_03540 [Oscillospiraceae bacterium]|jgi:hypothetical protein|nr:hypothetical protein [Oscillospiraceae bacterium]
MKLKKIIVGVLAMAVLSVGMPISIHAESTDDTHHFRVCNNGCGFDCICVTETQGV